MRGLRYFLGFLLALVLIYGELDAQDFTIEQMMQQDIESAFTKYSEKLVDLHFEKIAEQEDKLIIVDKYGSEVAIDELAIINTTAGQLFFKMVKDGPKCIGVADVIELWGRTNAFLQEVLISTPIGSTTKYGKYFKINDQDNILLFNARKFHSDASQNYFIELSGIEYYPEDAPNSVSSVFSFVNEAKLWLVIKIDKPDEVITIAASKDRFNHFINRDKLYIQLPIYSFSELEDDFRSYPIEIDLIISRDIDDLIYSGVLEDNPDLSTFPPRPPRNIKISNNYIESGDVKLQWSGQGDDITAYKIYRERSSNFTPDDSKNLIAVVPTTTNEYVDPDLQDLKYYYYRIKSVNSGNLESPASGEEYVYTDIEATFFNKFFSILGSEIADFFASIIPSSDGPEEVHISYENVSLKNGMTSNNNDISFQINAPLKPGKYPVSMNTMNSFTSNDYYSEIVIPYNDTIEYDISVRSLDLINRNIYQGNTIQYNYLLENKRDIPSTSIILESKIYNTTNQFLYNSTNSVPAIQGVGTYTSNINISNYPKLSSGTVNYLETVIKPVMDFSEGNNSLRKPFFAYPQRQNKTYRLQEEYFIYENDAWMRSLLGYNIAIQEADSTGIKIVLNGSTSSLSLDRVYLFDDDKLMIIPETYFDVDSIICIRIGVGNTSISYQNNEDWNYRSKDIKYLINHNLALENDFEIFTGLNASYFRGLNNSIETVTANQKLLSFDLPNINSRTTNSTWIKLFDHDDDYWYLTRIYGHQEYLFDISIDDFSIDNKSDDDDLVLINYDFSIDFTINNNSSYSIYNQPVEVLFSKDNTILMARSYRVDIEPNSAYDISCLVPGFGLVPGTYDINIRSPFMDDFYPSNNEMSRTVTLSEVPQLTLDKEYIEKSGYIVNTEENIKLRVQRNGEYINDAKVLAKLTSPDGYEHSFTCNYDPEIDYYTYSFVPSIGGRYELELSAFRDRSRGIVENLDFPVYSYLYVEVSNDNVTEGNMVALDIVPELVGNVKGLAFDLDYDSELLDYLRYETLGVLEEDGNVDTKVMVTESQQGITIGYTRLKQEDHALNIFTKSPVLRFYFRAKKKGKQQFEINHFGGIDNKARRIEFMGNEQNADLEILENKPSVNFFNFDNENKVNDTSCVYMNMQEINNLGTISGKIIFRDSISAIVDVEFGDHLTDVTELIKVVQIEDSILQFGLTRQGKEVLLDDFSGNILKIKYRNLKSGVQDFRITEFECKDRDAVVTYTAETSDFSTTILPDEENTTLFFDPDSSWKIVDSTFTLHLKSKGVKNCYAFAADLYYDPDHLRIDNIYEGDLLEGENVNTSFLADKDTDAGRITIGYSRLGQEPGVDSDDTITLLTFDVTPLKLDTSEIVALNPLFIRPDGTNYPPIQTKNCYIASDDTIQPYFMDSVPEYYLAENDTLKLYLDSIHKLVVNDDEKIGFSLKDNDYFDYYFEDSLYYLVRNSEEFGTDTFKIILDNKFAADSIYLSLLLPGLNVEPELQEVSSLAGEVFYTIDANTEWSVDSEEEWISCIKMDETKFAVNFNENKTTEERTTSITITGSGILPRFVTMIQEGVTPQISVSPSSLLLGAGQGIDSLNVNANVDWEVNNNSQWLSTGKQDSVTIIVEYESNTSLNERSAELTISGPGATTQLVTIIQEGMLPELSVDSLSRSVPYEAGNITFKIISNFNWVADESVDWLLATKSNDSILIVDYDENTGLDKRTGTIELSGAGEISEVLTIIQDGKTINISSDCFNGTRYKVYPNPADDKLYIQPGVISSHDLYISIYDFTGKCCDLYKMEEMITDNICVIDISYLAKGVYILKINDSFTYKIVK